MHGTGRKATSWHTVWRGKERREGGGLTIKARVFHCFYLDYYIIFPCWPGLFPAECGEQFLLHDLLHHLNLPEIELQKTVVEQITVIYKSWSLSRCSSHLNDRYNCNEINLCRWNYLFPTWLVPTCSFLHSFMENVLLTSQIRRWVT